MWDYHKWVAVVPAVFGQLWLCQLGLEVLLVAENMVWKLVQLPIVAGLLLAVQSLGQNHRFQVADDFVFFIYFQFDSAVMD